MSGGDWFLVVVIVSFVGFGLLLGFAGWEEGRNRRARGG
jgi:hypothetical protein